MGAGKYLSLLRGQINPSDSITPEGYTFQIILELIANGESPEFSRLLTLATADGDAQAITFFTNLLADGLDIATKLNAAGGGADVALSNLTSPTAINQSLVPDDSNTYSLGTSDSYWSQLAVNYAIANDGSNSIDLFSRYLVDRFNVISIDYSVSRLLRNAAGTQVMDWSNNGFITFNAVRLTDLVDPVDPQDAATKAYVLANAGGGGASVALDNLTSPTAINQPLRSASGISLELQGSDSSTANPPITTVTGGNYTGAPGIRRGGGVNIVGGGGTSRGGGVNISGGSADTQGGSVGVFGGDAVSGPGTGGNVVVSDGKSIGANGTGISISTSNQDADFNSGSLTLSTSSASGVGNSGDIILSIGSVDAGALGEFQFSKGIANTIGDVWTATSVDGKGYWAPLGGGSTDLIFDTGASATVKTKDTSGSSSFGITLTTGSSSVSGNTGNATISTGNSAGSQSGRMIFTTGSSATNGNSGRMNFSTSSVTGTGVSGGYVVNTGNAGIGNTGDFLVTTGDASDTGKTGDASLTTGASVNGDSGGIKLKVGTAGGTQGKIQLVRDGVANAIGDVWTATSIDGEGYWSSATALSSETALGALTWAAGVAPSGTISKTYRSSISGKQITVTAKITATVAGTAVTAVSFPLPTGLPPPAVWATQESSGLVVTGSGTVVAGLGDASTGGSGLYSDGAGGWVIKIFDLAALSAVGAFGQVTYNS